MIISLVNQKGGVRAPYIIAVMVVLLILPGMVWGVDAERSRETLRGIKGVQVLIEDIDLDIKKNDLTESQIRADVELKLRLAGLNVLSEKERVITIGRPWFLVSVNGFKYSSGSYVYNVIVELWQDVYVLRNDKGTVAPTWSTGYIGIAPDTDIIRDKIKDYVDIFLNAWLSVNPK